MATLVEGFNSEEFLTRFFAKRGDTRPLEVIRKELLDPMRHIDAEWVKSELARCKAGPEEVDVFVDPFMRKISKADMIEYYEAMLRGEFIDLSEKGYIVSPIL